MKNSRTLTGNQLPPNWKSSRSAFRNSTALAGLAFALVLGLSLTVSARVIDNFNDNLKTAWTDTANGGDVTEAGGAFTITSTAVAGTLTSSRKTSETFANAAGHTIELRVGVNSIAPAGGGTNGHAVLGWVPTGALLSSGYYLSVGVADITVGRAGGSSYATNLPANIQSSNLVLVLRLTPSGTSVDAKGSVYKKGAGNYTLLFEYTLTDGTGLIGTGNAALGALNQPSGTAASVVFDDLEAFDILNSEFASGFTAARLPEASLGGGAFATADGWVDYRPAGAINNTSVPGELAIISAPAAATYLNATYYNGKTFKISDGSRLEFQVDVKTGSDNIYILPLISYLPNGLPDLSTLATYFIGQSTALLAAGKSASIEWVPNSVIPLKNSNVRFIQNMSGEGTAVRLEQRIEDLDVGVNDPGRVLFQTAYLDGAATYINKNGYYCLLVYHAVNAGAVGNTCTFDNALVNQTAPGNTPPIIGSVSPGSGKAFLAATNRVTFTVADDVNTPLNNIVLTLNGVRYTNGSPGVGITPTGSTSTFRTFTLSNLTANVYYNGNISATDNVGASSSSHYEFDTFLTNNLVVELEEYNFTTNFVDGGVFIDNPLLIPVDFGQTDPLAYNGVSGIANVDFHDNQGGAGFYPSANHQFRSDAPRNNASNDGPRDKYVLAGGAGSGVREVIMTDISNGDWLNYTRTYSAGTFNAFLRESTYSMPQSLVTLEKVTSDPTTTGQSTTLLGSFVQFGDIAGDTGFGVHRNVPLTDASGNQLVIRFSVGVQTLRVNDRSVDFSGSEIFQNYMVFVPVSDPGTLRPIVAMTSPLANSTIRESPMPEATFAVIADRDTSVNVGTVALQINGVAIPSAVVTAIAGGAQVAWSLTNLPPSRVLTNTLTYKDSDGTNLTYSWTYSYPFLSATSRLPLGSLTARGFDYRMVQTDNGGVELGDDLITAEGQVAIPPAYPFEVTTNTIEQTLIWANSGNGGPPFVPGDNLILGTKQNIAAEIFAYLHLTAGAHRFYVDSDRGLQLRSGATLSDVNAVVLVQASGRNFNGSFDFIAEADGLYPTRLLWYQDGGGTYKFRLNWVDLNTGSNTNLVNDPLDPAGVVKAYLPGVPTLLLSSAAVGGPYTTAGGSVINTATKTVTVPVSGSMQFYRMQSSSAVTIQSITVAGGNVLITYQ